MEMNVSTIEKAFLSLPVVANELGTAEIKKLVKVEQTADAKRWEASKQIAKLVAKAHAWYKSDEGKALMESEGIDWKVDDLYRCIGGWGKSYGNRLKSVGQLTDEKVAEYEQLHESEPQKFPRDLKEILKWSKTGSTSAEAEGEGEGEGEGEDNPKQTWISVAVKGRNGASGFSLRITMDGQIKGDAERLGEVIALLTEASGGGLFEPSILVDEEEEEDEF